MPGEPTYADDMSFDEVVTYLRGRIDAQVQVRVMERELEEAWIVETHGPLRDVRASSREATVVIGENAWVVLWASELKGAGVQTNDSGASLVVLTRALTLTLHFPEPAATLSA